jgi:diaminopimelate epimerase
VPTGEAKTIEFVKLSGSGNDFVCIDNRDGRFDALLDSPVRIGDFARAVCSRGMGVGADGVIFACRVEDGIDADIAARFLEADGSEAELCGNGTAVFVRWAVANRWFGPPAHEPPGADPLDAFGDGATDAEIRVLTQAGIVRGKPVDGLYIRVCIPLPHDMRLAQELKLNRRLWQYDYVVTGVPHAVAQVADVHRTDVARWGPAFRHHATFQPRGVNANFVQVLGEGQLAIRTFEFGVEAETLACGTGCAASAILSTIRHNWPAAYRNGDEPVLLRTRSGDVLRVYLKLQSDNSVTDLCLDTIVRFAFAGKLHPQLMATAMGGQDK